MSDTTTPRVWIGCLACYNAGRLVGGWLDGIEAADVTTQDVHEGQASMPPSEVETHEELWVFDFEGYGDLLTEETSPVEAAKKAEYLVNAQEAGVPVEAAAAFADHAGHVPNQIDDLLDAYRGEYDSLEEYVETFYEDTGALGSVSEELRYHINWTSVARDWEMSGDVFTVRNSNGNVYVFED